MKVLIIGGNRYVGLRLARKLSQNSKVDLTIVNRRGMAPQITNAQIAKSSRQHLASVHLDRDWDAVIDFACYSRADARASLDFFKNVGRYIHISTVSVYEARANILESEFDPSTPPSGDESDLGDYGRFKREAEREFTAAAPWPCQLVRFPIILGNDDYTGRLDFHVERVIRNQMIYFPNMDARLSFISSEDAARYLFWNLNSNTTGPVNVASQSPIKILEFINYIESSVGKKALLATQKTESNESPFGCERDFFVDVSLCERQGFRCEPISLWLPQLIAERAHVFVPPKQIH